MKIVYIGTGDVLAETLAERMGQEGNDVYLLSDKAFAQKPKGVSLHRFYRRPRKGEAFGKLLRSISPDCVIFAGNSYIGSAREEESDEDVALLARTLRTAAAFPRVRFILLSSTEVYPVLGFLIYFLPDLLQMFLERMGVDREAILIHAFEVDLQPEHPDVREALNVVPVEDAMAVSGNTEKRALLLGQLKKDLTENYRVLLAAERDRDSESTHYAAVAKMEIYRLHQTRWLECCRDYAQDPGDPEKFHTACEVLTEMLESGVLSSREQSAYQKRLCDLVQGQIDAAEGEVFPKEYEEYFLDNFPMITPEDDELCRRLYGYSAEGFVRDVMWPAFQGVSLRSNTHYTSGILAAASSEERFETGNDAVLTTICKSALKFGGELAYAVNCQEDGKIVWNQDFIDRFSGLFTGYTVQGLTMETDNFSPEMLDIPGAEIRAVRGMLESRDTRLSWGPILP